jgi:photosystem II stability/assembly factor-like uncharacterized protein
LRIAPALPTGVLAAAVATAAAAAPWVGANPGAGGAFTSIGAGPTGVILCGSDLGGAYRSLDHGRSWDAIGPRRGMDVTHVSAVGFDPRAANIMYLGSERGVFRSDDGGASFRKVSAPGYIAAVVPAPSNPEVVYAPFHPRYDSIRSGLLESTDRGLTWHEVGTNLPDSLRITKLLVHPTHPGVLYLVSDSDLFVRNAVSSLWSSGDGGRTWTRIGRDLGKVWDLAVDPADPRTLYATSYVGTPRSKWSGSTWTSPDGGLTWMRLGGHTGCVLVKRDEPRTLWVIDPGRDAGHPEQGVWQSADGGASWSRRSDMSRWDPGWQAPDWAFGGSGYGMAKVFGQDLSDPNVIFWTHWQFVFGSFDGGGRFANLFTREVSPGWWATRGIENVAVTAVAISEADPMRVYAGYFDLGLWRSLDGGASWQAGNQAAFTGAWKGHGGCTTSIAPDPARAGVVFATMGETADRATVVRSGRGGERDSWTAANGGLPVGFVYGLSLDRTSAPSRRALFVTANGDVYRSADDGATWSRVLASGTCRVTAVDRLDGRTVYAGGEGGLWRSTAAGAAGSWERIGPAAFAGAARGELKKVLWTGVHAITPDPRAAGRVYVAAFGKGGGIYRSDDRGGAWTHLRAGDFFRDIAVNPSNPDELLATSSRAYKAGGPPEGSEGVLRSTDGGRSWLALNDGLPWPFAGPIAIGSGPRPRVIVGSPGTGFWTRDLGPAVEKAPQRP